MKDHKSEEKNAMQDYKMSFKDDTGKVRPEL